MYASNQENGGVYTTLGFIQRGMQLVSPIEFHKTYKSYFPKWGICRELLLLFDYYYSLLRYGATVCDYYEYEFWGKTHLKRKEYITMLSSKKMQKFFNSGSPELLVNKKKFNTHFAKYRNIKNFYFEDGGSLDDFLLFVEQCNRNIIAKTFWGASGIGIYKPDVTSAEKAKNVYETLKADPNYFCEECFVQTGIIGEVNPYSVNTIRVYTLNDGQNVHIMNAMVRFGGSKACVDNIHSGGMSCEVDVERGVVVGPGYNLKNKKTVFHPLSNITLPGIVIPNWQTVKDYCVGAAKLIPNYGYIGWDVAVSLDKVCIIEGNEVANVDLPQTACQHGIKDSYWAVMNEVKARRK